MSKKFHLKIIEGNDVGSVFEVIDGSYDICRANNAGVSTSVDRTHTIFLRDPESSKKHARLSVISGELVVEDIGSTNGIFINGKKVIKSILLNNDKLLIGTTTFLVNIGESELSSQRTFVGSPSNYSKPTHDFKKLAKVADSHIVFNPNLDNKNPYQDDLSNVFYNEVVDLINKTKETYTASEGLIKSYFFEIDVVDGPAKGNKYRFYRREILVGRVGDVILSDDSLSREHARIEVMENALFRIKDLGSQNGTYINNTRIQVATFGMNDSVKLGSSVLKFTIIEDDL